MSAVPAASAKPTVVIHTNDRQLVAARVGAHSLKSRSKRPDLFDVRLLRLEETPHLYRRNNQKFVWWEGNAPSVFRRRDLQSFAPLRRMVPALMGFQGRALVLDPDVFAIGDVNELLTRDMEGKAILCCQKSEWRDGRRMASGGTDRTVFYRPHPDPRQERLFFALLKECLDEGSITRGSLRQAMRKNYLRKDTFRLLEGLP